jgi:hypothetical protein
MREGELYGLGEEDFDLDGQKVLRVRRQIKRIGRDFVFARYPPRPYTLPWEAPTVSPIPAI